MLPDILVQFADDRTCLAEDGDWQVHLVDSLQFMQRLPEASVDLVLTDPPYSAETHKNVRTNKAGFEDKSPIDFEPITFKGLRSIVALAGRITKRWVAMTCEYKMAVALELDPPPGVDFVRHGIWVKRDAMPQKSGDRPGMGWEALVFLHRADERLRWNGGGRSGVFTHTIVRGGHPTEKPVPLGEEIIQLFTDPGDVVLDPFCGSGAFLEAARLCNRSAIGCELDEEWARHAVRRLSQRMLPFGRLVPEQVSLLESRGPFKPTPRVGSP